MSACERIENRLRNVYSAGFLVVASNVFVLAAPFRLVLCAGGDTPACGHEAGVVCCSLAIVQTAYVLIRAAPLGLVG